MKVRFLQGMGEVRGPGIRPGEVRDVDQDEAERLIARDIAEPYSEDTAATRETIKGIKQSGDDGFEEIVSAVIDEASRRGVTTEVSPQEANLVTDASDEDLVELAKSVHEELKERELELPGSVEEEEQVSEQKDSETTASKKAETAETATPPKKAAAKAASKKASSAKKRRS